MICKNRKNNKTLRVEFFEKSNKIEKLSQTKKRDDSNKIRNERGDIITDVTEIVSLETTMNNYMLTNWIIQMKHNFLENRNYQTES